MTNHEKPLTDYSPALALKRTRFYLDVMEAHFAALGVDLAAAQAEGRRTIANRFQKTKPAEDS